MSEFESEPLELFLYAIRSSATKRKYQRILKSFLDFLEIPGEPKSQAKSFIEQARQKGNSWVFASLMNFVTFQKERAERGEISLATVRNYYKPLKLFLEMNDIELSWKRISRGLPKGRRYAADRAPTIEEIQKLLEYPDRRIKAIVSTMCSSGMRLGGWDYLRWKHVIPIKQEEKVIAAKLVVYAGEEEQYTTFISPEAYEELKKWMDTRSEAGEKITDDSWLMRDIWNVEKYARGLVTTPRQLRSAGVKRLVERALKAQGIRKSLPVGQKRHEFQADHGFRKFFKTRAEQLMKPINVEILMSHSTGISDSYYRPNENELLKDYMNAIPELTISSEHRQNLKVRKQDEIISELASNQKEITQLKEGIEIISVLLAEQQVKNNIWGNLENPTHHHTPQQIVHLKEFCNTEHIPEVWQAFLDWAKKGSKEFSHN